jgi:hypothetical protein
MGLTRPAIRPSGLRLHACLSRLPLWPPYAGQIIDKRQKAGPISWAENASRYRNPALRDLDRDEAQCEDRPVPPIPAISEGFVS